MESISVKKETITRFFPSSNPIRLLLGVFIIALIAGGITGYMMASQKGGTTSLPTLTTTTPKTATQDTQTFRDFAQGVIKAKPQPKDPSEYVEGTHTLEREGAVPVDLTSSVVDLSQYEGKKVKVYGETQKALRAGWLMDVGKVEEIQ